MATATRIEAMCCDSTSLLIEPRPLSFPPLWLVVGFFIPEMIAIISGHTENTFSDQIWHLEGTGSTFFRWVVASTFAWLFLHTTFRLFT
jgi:hypothetical protein